MAHLEIQLQIRKMLKPSTPTPKHLHRLNLSLFDHPHTNIYVPTLFHYFPSTEWNKTENSIHERCDKLQSSLAAALAKFYPLAGRFNEDDFSIHCNDEGVEYIETSVNAVLAEFFNDGPKIELLNDLLPWVVTPKSEFPLLGVQVNIFNCGGLVMGIQFSHILADAFTLATFVNEWSHIVQTGTTNKGCLSTFGHLPSLFPTRVISRPQYSPPPDIVTKIVTRRFVFDALSIGKLKENIESNGTFMKSSTRVVIVMSLIWKVLVSISSAKHGRPRDSTILFALNLRGKSNLPSTEHALGNFCLIGNATVEAKKSIKELKDFVNLVGSTIRDTSVGIGNASIDEVSSVLINNNTEILNKFCQKDKMDIYVITSWCKFPLYEADFGWGKPFWVSGINNTTENIRLFDTKDGGGIEAWVGLKENDMAEFETDLDILTFCPPRKQPLIPQFG